MPSDKKTVEMSEDDIRSSIRKLLDANLYHGYCDALQTEYWTIHPSPGTYPFQYFWDTCLHAFILTSLDEAELATKTLRSLYALQADDGFVGHMLYWDRLTPGVWTDTFQAKFADLNRPHMSALIQPPLSPQAVQRVWHHTNDNGFLKEMVPKMKKHFDWLAANRDLDGDGLLTIVNMFESGIDWKPSMDSIYGHTGQVNQSLYDKVISNDYYNFINNYDHIKTRAEAPFLVKEVAFNTIYARNLEVLSMLCKQIGDSDGSARYDELSKKVNHAIQSKMYDSQAAAFWDLRAPNDQPLKTLTPTIFFPIALPTTTTEQARAILDKHFHNTQEFATTYPLPSVAANDPSYDPAASKFLWRGPTWALYNWYVYQALFYNGFAAEAQTLRVSIRALISKSGFREYYHPTSGVGGGAQHFTWSGLILDMLTDTGAQHI
jgi:hypothetical protein